MSGWSLPPKWKANARRRRSLILLAAVGPFVLALAGAMIWRLLDDQALSRQARLVAGGLRAEARRTDEPRRRLLQRRPDGSLDADESDQILKLTESPGERIPFEDEVLVSSGSREQARRGLLKRLVDDRIDEDLLGWTGPSDMAYLLRCVQIRQARNRPEVRLSSSTGRPP